ncbi:MAG: protein kinase domain-containing protein [Anaerolineae bacterium]
MDRNTLSGQVLGGRYRIDEILGQGGMSAVYKAYDPNLKRVVAVKTIHTHLADDPSFVVRFEEEATAVAQLRHPNIVQVFDFSHDGELYYMVQELLPGETLQERLRRLNKMKRRMPAAEAIAYTLNICDAVGYAHLRGMIHRDIKPANIMLDTQGQAVLMDFGIVKISGSQQHTATGTVVGTALYLSPEVIRGEVPDARSDLYSLGVTLYEMVSGRPPFEADSAMALMMMHIQEPVPDLRGLRPDVPEGLIAVIEKSLAKDRDSRYRSMAEMMAALKVVQDQIEAGIELPATQIQDDMLPTQIDQPRVSQPAQSPVEARTELVSPAKDAVSPGGGRVDPHQPRGDRKHPPPPRASGSERGAASTGGASSWWQRSQAWVWIAGAAIFLVVVVAGVLLAGPFSGAEGDEPAGTAPAGTGVVVALVSDAGCLLGPAADYPTVAELAEGQQLPVLGMSADEAWWNVVHPQRPADSCWLPASVAQVSGDISTLPLVEAPPLPTATPSPSVAIQQITIDQENRYVVDYLTEGFTEKLPGTHLHFFFNTFSPEQIGISGTGDRLMYGGPTPFVGYATTDRSAEATEMCVLVANPDHSVVLDSGNCFPLPVVGDDVREEPPASGRAELVALETVPPAASPPADTPAELTPTSASPTDVVVPLTPTPAPATATSPPPTKVPTGPRFGRLAFTSWRDGNPEIYVIDLGGGNPVRLTTNEVDDWLPDWTPDGSRIAFTSNRQEGYDTWVMNGNGGEQTRLLTTPAWDDYPRWAPDGQRLALATTGTTEGVANSEIHVSDPYGKLLRLTNTTAEDQWPDWSPDGRLIFSEGFKGTSDWDLYVMNGDGSGHKLWLGGPTCDVQPAWSPDGEWVAFIRNTRDTDGNGVTDVEDAGDLWVAQADGSGLRQLTHDQWTITPAWSPDSQWIAVAQVRDSNSNGHSDVQDVADIWAIPLGGGEPVLLVRSPYRDSDPSWAQ